MKNNNKSKEIGFLEKLNCKLCWLPTKRTSLGPTRKKRLQHA